MKTGRRKLAALELYKFYWDRKGSEKKLGRTKDEREKPEGEETDRTYKYRGGGEEVRKTG